MSMSGNPSILPGCAGLRFSPWYHMIRQDRPRRYFSSESKILLSWTLASVIAVTIFLLGNMSSKPNLRSDLPLHGTADGEGSSASMDSGYRFCTPSPPAVSESFFASDIADLSNTSIESTEVIDDATKQLESLSIVSMNIAACVPSK